MSNQKYGMQLPDSVEEARQRAIHRERSEASECGMSHSDYRIQELSKINSVEARNELARNRGEHVVDNTINIDQEFEKLIEDVRKN